VAPGQRQADLPRTVNDYRSLIEAKIKPALGGKRLNKIDVRTLDAFYQELRRGGNAKAERQAKARVRTEATAQGRNLAEAESKAKPTAAEKRLSASRVHDVHVVISGALGLAARWGWLPFNPALVVRPESGRGQPRTVPTAEQVGQLFAVVADDPEFTAFLRLSATTGLRPGEICALRWSDLDLEAAEVSVNANIVTTKGLPDGYLRKPPKSEHGARVLALDPGTVEALRAHQALRALIVRELEGDALTAESFVFARTPDGTKPIRPDAMTSRFTALAVRLGVEYRLYGLRHFMATQLGAVAAAGTVRDRMGHGSLAVTSGYMHPVTEADRAAAEHMGTLIDRAKGKAKVRSIRHS
jgi:integrase